MVMAKKKITSKKTKNSLSREVSHAEIQKKAYELYEERGRIDGNDLNDWFKAEEVLLKNE